MKRYRDSPDDEGFGKSIPERGNSRCKGPEERTEFSEILFYTLVSFFSEQMYKVSALGNKTKNSIADNIKKLN